MVLKEARADFSSRPVHTGLSRSTLLPRESERALSSAVGKIQEPMFQAIDAPTSCVTLQGHGSNLSSFAPGGLEFDLACSDS